MQIWPGEVLRTSKGLHRPAMRIRWNIRSSISSRNSRIVHRRTRSSPRSELAASLRHHRTSANVMFAPIESMAGISWSSFLLFARFGVSEKYRSQKFYMGDLCSRGSLSVYLRQFDDKRDATTTPLLRPRLTLPVKTSQSVLIIYLDN